MLNPLFNSQLSLAFPGNLDLARIGVQVESVEESSELSTEPAKKKRRARGKGKKKSEEDNKIVFPPAFMDFLHESDDKVSDWKIKFERSLAEFRDEAVRTAIVSWLGQPVYDLWCVRHELLLDGVSSSFMGKMHPCPLGISPDTGLQKPGLAVNLDFKQPSESDFPKPGKFFTRVIEEIPKEVSLFSPIISKYYLVHYSPNALNYFY